MGNFPPLINLRFQHLFFPYDTREKDFSLHTLFLILNGFSTRFSTYVENLWKEWRFSSFKTRTNSFAESFDQTFSKVCAGGGREALREVCKAYGKSLATSTSCRRRNPFILPKAPEGVNFRRKEGEPQVGFPLIKKHTPLVLSISTVNWSNPIVPLFLLAKKAQKKKLGKKKYAVKGVSTPAGVDSGLCPENPQPF